MTDETAHRRAEATLTLPPVLDLTGAASLKLQLEKALSAGADLVVDGGEVVRVTSPGLQVLASAAISFRRAGGRGMVFDTMSPALSDSIETLALNFVFDRRTGA